MQKYKRVLIKLSGEALAGDKGRGVDFEFCKSVCTVIKRCIDDGIQVAIVVGGGNFWRGVKEGKDLERSRADHIGMMATVMNALALADVFEHLGCPVRVQTALEITAVAEPYIRLRALKHLEAGRVVILACGTGHPYFSTDTAAVLRAAEINADAILLAKNIDGVYDSDPKTHLDAVKFTKITNQEILERNLLVMDLTATSLSKDNKIPIVVFALSDPENIYRAANGDTSIGTIVTDE